MPSLVPTTELDAVNEMLSVIGESPVNSLSGSLPQDAALAQNLLHRVSREVQTEGWWFNEERDYELIPDGDGYINLPSDALFCDVDPSREHSARDVVWRGTRLYDRIDQTYVFTSSLKTELIRFLAFEDLPEAARWYITVKAARKFQDRVQGSPQDHAYTEMDEIRALALLRRSDARSGDYTIFSHWTTARGLFRRPRY